MSGNKWIRRSNIHVFVFCFESIECHDRFEIEMDQYELVANFPS